MQEGKSGLEKIIENLSFIYFFVCLFLKKQERRKERILSVCAQGPCPCLQCSSSVPWDMVGEEKLYCPEGDHETQVDVQIVIIHDHRNYFKL